MNITLLQCGVTPAAPQISITAEERGYAVFTPYDPKFVHLLKTAIPSRSRFWNKQKRAWMVTADYINQVQAICEQVWNIRPEIPAFSTQPGLLTRTFRLEYLGACKDRGGQYPAACGYSDGCWSIEMSEPVLRQWFKSQTQISELTLYSLLTIDESAQDSEIKSAYRRLARQWHPDMCREENAAEMFRAIQQAYDTLSNPEQRRKYNAGLFLERSTKQQPTHSTARKNSKYYSQLYRSPLRCGLVTVTGCWSAGRFAVTEILTWSDLVNDKGQIGISSWPKGADHFEILWA